MNYFNDLISQAVYLPANTILLAQEIHDPDLLGQIQHTWNHFVQTGQIWALLIGVVIGYIFKNLTSYN